MNIAMTLRDAATRLGERSAVHFGTQCLSYSRLEESSNRVAAGLRAHGIRPGDRVALISTNRLELILSIYGCWKLGAVAVLIKTGFTPPELAYCLSHVGTRAAIVERDHRDKLLTAESSLRERLFPVFAIGGSEHPSDLDFATLLNDHGECEVAVDAEFAVILYSSGSSARPKAIAHKHHGLSKMLEHDQRFFALSDRDIAVVDPGLVGCYALFLGMLMPLSIGAQVVLLPVPGAQSALRAIEEHRATYFLGNPTSYLMMTQAATEKAYRLDSVRIAVTACDKTPIAVHHKVKQTLGWQLIEGYGQTEGQPHICNRIDGSGKLGSVGKGYPGREIRLVDEQGRDVPDGQLGEILVRGEHLLAAYWNEPELTANTLRDGWLHTGDLASRDADGYYFIFGRKNQIIIRGGTNISPLEVEQAIAEHPEVLLVGVVGVRDPLFGERVKALIVRQPEGTLNQETLLAFLSERLAVWKRPEIIEFVDSLSFNQSGKIDRRALWSRC